MAPSAPPNSTMLPPALSDAPNATRHTISTASPLLHTALEGILKPADFDPGKTLQPRPLALQPANECLQVAPETTLAMTPSVANATTRRADPPGNDPGAATGQRIRRHRFVAPQKADTDGKQKDDHTAAVPPMSPKVAALIVDDKAGEHPDPDSGEYQTLEVLGQGGMGIVRRVRQNSLCRDVAIKSIRPALYHEQKIQDSFTNQELFVSEAVITAALVHPNIIPVHDLGLDDQGRLFYSMKEVKGKPWSGLIEREDPQRRRVELEKNLEILLKVCDAVAYAHRQGVINRDLKPENVAVGEYGEVIVLDWGLAVPLDDVTQSGGAPTWPAVLRVLPGPAGTPGYMAPELAEIGLERICSQTDVYLLGAMLFEILEGYPPHLLQEFQALPKDQLLRAVFDAVVQNRIEENVQYKGELMDIARKAMETDPEDRFGSVKEFQEAIRQYRITGRAEELLRQASLEREQDKYELYQQSAALFAKALTDWPNNPRAQKGDRVARLAFAQLALKRGDFDLGLEVLGQNKEPDLATLRTRLRRQRTQRKLIRGTWLILGACAAALLVWLVITKRDLALQNEELELRNDTIAQQNDELERRNGTIAQQDGKIREGQDKLSAQAKALATVESELTTKERELNLTDELLRAEKDKANKATDDAKKALTAAEDAQRQANEATEKKQAADMELKKAKEESDKVQYQRFQDRLNAAEDLRDWQQMVEIAEDALRQLADNPQFTDLKKKAIEERLEGARRKAREADGNGSVRLEQQLRLPGNVRNRAVLIPQGGGLLQLIGAADREEVTGIRVLAAAGLLADGLTSSALLPLPEPLTQQVGGVVKISATADAGLVWLSYGADLYVWGQESAGQYRLLGKEVRPAEILEVQADREGRLFVISDDDFGSVAIYQADEGRLKSLLPQGTVLFAGKLASYPCSDFAVTPDGRWLLHFSARGNDRHVRAFAVDWRNLQAPELPQEVSVVPLVELPQLENSGNGGPEAVIRVDDMQIATAGNRLLLSVTTREGERWYALLNSASADVAVGFPFGPRATWFRSGSERAAESIRLSPDGGLIIAAHHRNRSNLEAWRVTTDGVQPFPLPDQASARVRNSENSQGSLISGLSQPVLDVCPLDSVSGRFLTLSEKFLTRWNLSTYGDYIEEMRAIVNTFSGERTAVIPRVPGGAGRVLLTMVPASEDELITTATPVDSAELSADGERLILGSRDRAVRVLNTVDLQPVLNLSGRPDPLRNSSEQGLFLEGHSSNITAGRFLGGDSGLLLTSESLGVVSVWDARSDSDGLGREVSRLITGHGSGVFSVSADGGLIAADGAVLRGNQLVYQVLIWRAEDLRGTVAPEPYRRLLVDDEQTRAMFRQRQLQPSFQITATAISPGNSLIAVGGRQGELVLWTLAAGQVTALQQTHGGDQISGLWFLSETEFVSTGYDGRLLRWQLGQNGQLTSREVFAGQQVIALNVSPDGRWYLISDVVAKPGAKAVASPGNRRRRVPTMLRMQALNSADGTIRQLVELDIPLSRPEMALQTGGSWSEDGRQLLLALEDRLIVYDSTDWKPQRQLAVSGQSGTMSRAILAPASLGNQLMATITDRRAALWDMTLQKQICEFRSHHSDRLTASFSADRRLVLTSSEALRIFDADEASPVKGRTLYRIRPEESHRSPLEDARFIPIPGDYRFLSLERNGVVRLWGCTREGVPTAAPLWHSDDEVPQPITSDAGVVRWSPNGQWFVAIRSGRLNCWSLSGDVVTAVDLPIPEGFAGEWNDLCFSRDSGLLAAGGKGRVLEDGEIAAGLVWKLASGQPAVLAATLVDREQRLSAVNLVDEQNRDRILRGGITAVAFRSGDGQLVTGDIRGTILKWLLPASTEADAREPEFGGKLETRNETEGHRTRIISLSETANNGLISVDESGRIIRWP